LNQIERKANGQGIENLSPIQGVTKRNPNDSDAEFGYTDGARNETGKYSRGIVFEKAGNGIQFELPYSERRQEAKIYLGAWSAKVKTKRSGNRFTCGMEVQQRYSVQCAMGKYEPGSGYAEK